MQCLGLHSSVSHRLCLTQRINLRVDFSRLHPTCCSFPCCFAQAQSPHCSAWEELRRRYLLVYCCPLCSVPPGSSPWLFLYCTLDLGWVCTHQRSQNLRSGSNGACIGARTEGNGVDTSPKSLPQTVPVRIVQKSADGGCSETFSLVLERFL